MSMTAAPCEYPPSTSRVDGHCCAIVEMRLVGVDRAVGGGQEVVAGGIVDRVSGEGLGAHQRPQ